MIAEKPRHVNNEFAHCATIRYPAGETIRYSTGLFLIREIPPDLCACCHKQRRIALHYGEHFPVSICTTCYGKMSRCAGNIRALWPYLRRIDSFLRVVAP